jgi:hypothetical protein
MKKIILSVLITSFMTGCDMNLKASNDQQLSTTVSVILDVTDPRTYWPAPDQFLEMYHFKQRPDAEGVFRLRTISDKRLTPLVSFRLADAASMEKDNKDEDNQYRNRNVLAFYTTVRKAMNDFYSRTDTAQSLSNSECFRTIADELTFLSGSKSDQCILITASDLMDKSDLIDCYTANLANPKEIAMKFDQANLLPKTLTGITVIFLFSPKDRQEDQTFSLIVEAYRQLLQPKGVEIKVQANL